MCYIDAMISCPYCGVVPDREYKYGWKCADCKRKVAYDKRHLFIYGRDRLTQQEAAVVELFNRASIFLEATEEDYKRYTIAVEEKFGTSNPRDVVWAIINSPSLFGSVMHSWLQENKWMEEVGVMEAQIDMKVKYLNEALAVAREQFNKSIE